MSNTINLETLKSIPDLVVTPQVVSSRSNSLQIEWYDPILANSDDKIFYFLVDYRVKNIWNENGTIEKPVYESKVYSLFSSKTLTKTFTLTNLKPYTAFSFQVTAINSYGESRSEYSEDYYTREEAPKFQDEPKILEITSKSVYLTWVGPKIPNGIIRNYRLHALKYAENEILGQSLTISQNVTLKSNINTYLFENLEPFTFYLIDIESCNMQGCASSYTDSSNILESKSFLRTNESYPEQFDNPVIESFNSYSIGIEWREPRKPNGIIKYYILERIDFYPPLTIKIKNLENPEFTRYRKYKFDADADKTTIKFTDIDSLESCSVYSYRVIAFNIVGNISTEYVNVTVKSSKPLIVTSPIVNIIDSYTARFEWSTPITYCPVKAYYLNFKSETHSFRTDVDSVSFLKQSIIINNLNPFTTYDVSLVACVNVYDDPCTTSIQRSFRTPGTVPKNISPPSLRLISNGVISIEWLEPSLKNGISFEYQLIRVMLIESDLSSMNDDGLEDRSETIYIGKNRFYLDTSVSENEVYKYRVIYGNEFGNSLSDWSDKILVTNFTETPAYQIQDNIQTFFLIFTLYSVSESPTSVHLKWKTYKADELLNLVKNLIEKSNGMSGNQMLLFSNTQIDKITVLIEQLNNENLTNLTATYLISNRSDSILIDNKLIKNLKPDTKYSFKLNLYLSADITNRTVKSKQQFKFSSEPTFSQTLSEYEAFKSSLEIVYEEKNRIVLSYKISDVVENNYDLIEIKLNKRIDEKNRTDVIENTIIRNSNGNITYGPFEQNSVYSAYILACTKEPHLLLDNSNHFFKDDDCIKSYSLFYSITTLPPQNVSDIRLTPIDFESIKLDWVLIEYLLFK